MSDVEVPPGGTVQYKNMPGSRIPPDDSKIVLLIIIVVGVVATVAAILGSVSLARPRAPSVDIQDGREVDVGNQVLFRGPEHVYNPNVPTPKLFPGKMWTIAVGHDYGAHEYIDSKGYLAGFFQELISAVCNQAQINCRTIWDLYENCWNSTAGQHAMAGKGVQSKYYDACMGWSATVSRLQIVSFSMPFLKPDNAYFWVKKGISFNANDIRGKTIGFIDGWSYDEKCLARMSSITGRVLSVDRIKHYKTPEDLKAAILDNTIDAAFTGELGLTGNENIEKRSAGFQCAVTGDAVMTRKDGTFSSYWNTGFQKLLSSGAFAKLCENAKETHNAVERGPIDCVDS